MDENGLHKTYSLSMEDNLWRLEHLSALELWVREPLQIPHELTTIRFSRGGGDISPVMP